MDLYDLKSTDERLALMGHADIRAYLRGPVWGARKGRFHVANPLAACLICEIKDGMDLHHPCYSHIGNEQDRDLLPLCEDQHHEIERRIKRRAAARWDAHETYRDEVDSRQHRKLRRLDIRTAFARHRQPRTPLRASPPDITTPLQRATTRSTEHGTNAS